MEYKKCSYCGKIKLITDIKNTACNWCEKLNTDKDYDYVDSDDERCEQ